MTEVSYPITAVCLSIIGMFSIKEIIFNNSWQSLFRKIRKHYYLTRWWLGTPDFLTHISKYVASNKQTIRQAFSYTDLERISFLHICLPPEAFTWLWCLPIKKAESISILHRRCQFGFTSFDLLFLLNWVQKLLWFKGWLRGQVLCFRTEKPGLLHNSAT